MGEYSMKKVLIIIILLNILNLIDASQSGESLTECPKNCTWKYECDGWKVPDAHCEQMEWMGKKEEDQVCCCDCTGDGVISSEIF
jgi:hypothetical protein